MPPCRDRKIGCAHDAERKRAALSVKALSVTALAVASYLLAAGLLVGAGVFVARSLESPLLGFLGADFMFLLAASIYTAGPARSGRPRR